MFPLPVLCPPQSGRTHVIADSEHVPLRQQNPRNPAVSMTTHTPAYTTVKFQLPVDLLPDCCQSPWRGRERQAIPPGCCRVSWLHLLFIIKYSWLHSMSCLDTHNSFLQTQNKKSFLKRTVCLNMLDRLASGHTTTFFFCWIKKATFK